MQLRLRRQKEHRLRISRKKSSGMFIKISMRRACNKTILRNKSQVQGSSGEVKGGGITESIRLVLLYSRILRRPHKAVSIQFWMHLTDAGNPASLRSGKIPHCSAPVQIRGNPVFATIPVWEIPYRPPHIIRFQAMLYGRGPSAQFCAHAEIEAGASAKREARDSHAPRLAGRIGRSRPVTAPVTPATVRERLPEPFRYPLPKPSRNPWRSLRSPLQAPSVDLCVPVSTDVERMLNRR